MHKQFKQQNKQACYRFLECSGLLIGRQAARADTFFIKKKLDYSYPSLVLSVSNEHTFRGAHSCEHSPLQCTFNSFVLTYLTAVIVVKKFRFHILLDLPQSRCNDFA